MDPSLKSSNQSHKNRVAIADEKERQARELRTREQYRNPGNANVQSLTQRRSPSGEIVLKYTHVREVGSHAARLRGNKARKSWEARAKGQ